MLASVLAATILLAAQEGPAAPPEVQSALEGLDAHFGAEPDGSVQGELSEAGSPGQAGLFPVGPVSLIEPVWGHWTDAIDEAVGLRLGFSFTALYQHAFSSPGYRDVFGGDLDFIGKWRLLGEKGGPNNGYLGFYTEWRMELGAPVPSTLGPEIGSAWKTTDGFTDQPYCINQLWWEQHLFDDALVVTLGKLDPDNYYNTNRAASANLLFLNKAFSSNPARDFPSNGLGATARIQTDLWYVAGGFQDAQGKKTTSGFSTFGDGDFFYAGELGLTPLLEGLGQGNYRFTYWYSDAIPAAGDPSDQGFAFSFDQELVPEVFGAFLRYGYAQGDVTGIEQIVSGGVGGTFVPGRPDDVVGIGLAWGEPTGSAREQWTSEIFYRIQLAEREQLTVGMQFITDPSYNLDQDLIEVFETRLRIAF